MTFINFSPKVAVYEAFSSLKYLSLHPNILKILFYEKNLFIAPTANKGQQIK